MNGSKRMLAAAAFSALPVLLVADPRLDAIKALWASAAELDGEDASPWNKHVVTFNTMLPAVGLRTTELSFFYVSSQADPEEDPYLIARTLKKVRVEYNIAAGVLVSAEYLYDDRAKPAFYYWKRQSLADEGLPPDERRLYFWDGALIRAAGAYDDEKGKRLRYTADSGFSPDDLSEAALAMERALGYARLFAALVDAEDGI